MSLRTTLGIMMLLLGLTGPAGAAHVDASEQIKTAYLLSFAKLVRWPDAGSDRPLALCVDAGEALLQFMQINLNDKEVQQRVLRVHATRTAKRCDIRYQSEGLPADGSGSTLTVGEGAEFARRGGMLGFVSVDQKLRYVINTRALDEAGLKVDPRLLAAAVETVN